MNFDLVYESQIFFCFYIGRHWLKNLNLKKKLVAIDFPT